MTKINFFKTVVGIAFFFIMSISAFRVHFAQGQPPAYSVKCESPATYTFKSHKNIALGVELDIPDVWTEESKEGTGVKFTGPQKINCVDSGSLDFRDIKGFLPGKPYTLEEGKQFVYQQWMKPRELSSKLKFLETSNGFSAVYAADDFIGIAGVKIEKQNRPLVLVVFAARDGEYIEKRIVHMLNSLKKYVNRKKQ